MKRFAVLSLAVLMVLVLSTAAWALPFPITNVRALGMGGAFVAAGEGVGAVQHNPALLGENTTVEVSVPNLVLRIEDHIGVVDLIDDLNDLAPTDTTQAIAILNRLDKGDGLDIMASGSIGAGFSAFGLALGVSYADMIFGSAVPINIDATVAGIADTSKNLLQYGAVDAKQIILTGSKSLGNIILGANLRQIDADVYFSQESLFNDPGTGLGDVTDQKDSSESATALDVGVLFGALPMVDVGVMAKDINGPKIGDIDFEPRYRAGVAVNLPLVTVAADIDLSDKSIDEATQYQEWAVGAEVDVWAVALRGGLSQNTGPSGEPTLIHLGVGLGFLDIGAAYAEEGDYYIAGANLKLGF